jgi:hypothetical protein
VILPALQQRGNGDLLVRFERFDSDSGKVVTGMMPLADAGVLLDVEKSPTHLIPKHRAAWEAEQSTRAEQEAALQVSIARHRRLAENRKEEVARLQALPAAHRAALYVAHEIEKTQPKIAAAFAAMAVHLAGDDSDTLKAYVKATITDPEISE